MRFKKAAAVMAACSMLLGSCGVLSGGDGAAGMGQDMFSGDALIYRREARGDFMRAVWVSYLDIQPMMSRDRQSFAESVEVMLDNMQSISITDIFFQVRAFGDSIYPSAVFPSAGETIYDMSGGFDYLKLVVDAAHSRGIKLHAWINPYRLRSVEGGEYGNFLEGLLAMDENCVTQTENGISLNPASGVAQKLVIDGVRELLNYNIDGIHLDDYFYPATAEEFDAVYYAQYAASGGEMPLDEWRRANVTALIEGIYAAVKAAGPGIQLGIAPDASIERNMRQHYLDVELFCKDGGYLDYICPQIYFGYENQTMPFLETVSMWMEYSPACRVVVGLSFYKAGTEDKNAGSGSGEWLENHDIISRQYLDTLRIENCGGVAFFRYGSIFAPDDETEAMAGLELRNLRQVI
jgi:uncharacterized lipoprotein YddW (UPF0748 family)